MVSIRSLALGDRPVPNADHAHGVWAASPTESVRTVTSGATAEFMRTGRPMGGGIHRTASASRNDLARRHATCSYAPECAESHAMRIPGPVAGRLPRVRRLVLIFLAALPFHASIAQGCSADWTPSL